MTWPQSNTKKLHRISHITMWVSTILSSWLSCRFFLQLLSQIWHHLAPIHSCRICGVCLAHSRRSNISLHKRPYSHQLKIFRLTYILPGWNKNVYQWSNLVQLIMVWIFSWYSQCIIASVHWIQCNESLFAKPSNSNVFSRPSSLKNISFSHIWRYHIWKNISFSHICDVSNNTPVLLLKIRSQSQLYAVGSQLWSH